MKELKSPVYLYDEPAEYRDFSGGMNTNINDLGLLLNQMKLGINLDYDGTSLHIRKGGKLHTQFKCTEPLSKIQGVFMYSGSTTYSIVASNGKLYSGYFNENGDTNLSYLPIQVSELLMETSSSRVSFGLDYYQTGEEPSQNHDGYLELFGITKFLIFQNKWNIEAIQYKKVLYIATGTRICTVYEENPGQLIARILSPYKPNGIEYTQVGPNLLSYIPSVHLETSGNAARTSIHAIVPLKQTSGSIKITAVMSFATGENSKDYRFKWERSSNGMDFEPCEFITPDPLSPYISKYRDSRSIGHVEFTVDEEQALNYVYKCSFASEFKRDSAKEDMPIIIDTNTHDYLVDKIAGAWFGQAESIRYTPGLDVNSNEYYRQIQSCKKIFGYGNKFIIYDDAFNSGSFWKTVIDNPAYITYRGGMNFQTGKNEKLMRVINFKGVLVCFAYNQTLGGNISVVTGNGDDYNDGSQNYSPFARRIVNKTLTTDNANSVQVAENIIIFKYKDGLFMIEGSELNYEIVTVYEINTHVKQENHFIKIPFDDNDCISELTDNYYALYWHDEFDSDNNLIRPPYRLKMYYKNAIQNDNRIVFPFLLDQGEIFNTDCVVEIAGKSYSMYDSKLISFNDNYYKDLDKPYEFKIITRGYELNYPQFVKSILRFQIVFGHQQADALNLNVKIYNEALSEILKNRSIRQEGGAADGTSRIIKSDSQLTSYLILTPSMRETCMNATVELSGVATQDFSLSSFTFFYKTRSVPKVSPIERYKKIVRKGDRLVK